uniref:Uncharacterized protein n=1 Tax=Cacopsylla melanoneura TaxID=428564 RepID=A0A8D8LRQ6_9HEMI
MDSCCPSSNFFELSTSRSNLSVDLMSILFSLFNCLIRDLKSGISAVSRSRSSFSCSNASIFCFNVVSSSCVFSLSSSNSKSPPGKIPEPPVGVPEARRRLRSANSSSSSSNSPQVSAADWKLRPRVDRGDA